MIESSYYLTSKITEFLSNLNISGYQRSRWLTDICLHRVNHFLNWSCSCLLLWRCLSGPLIPFILTTLHIQFSESQTTFVIIRLYMVVRDIIVLFWHFSSIFVSKVSPVTHSGKCSMDKTEERRVKRLRDTHRTLSATHPLILTDKRIYSPLVNEVMASTATTFGIM